MHDDRGMNDLQLAKAHDGTEYRELLIDYEEEVEIEGIAQVCRVPEHVLSMTFLVPGTPRLSNFKASEFANRRGLLKVHPTLIIGAQAVRDDLKRRFNREIGIFVTCGLRTQEDQHRLAVTEGLGWTDEGGRVSRTSMHLHGCAMDFYAWDWRQGQRVPKEMAANAARKYFDYVQTYPTTGHVHADQRYKAGILTP